MKFWSKQKPTLQFTQQGKPVIADKIQDAYAYAYEISFLNSKKKSTSECPDEDP